MKKIHDFYFPEWDNHFQKYFNPNRGYQEEQRNRALSFVKDFGVAVDCGAHVGLWSRDLSNFFENLYCFEPVKEFFECLKLNVNSKNVKLYNLGLGEKEKEVEFIVTNSLGNSGNSMDDSLFLLHLVSGSFFIRLINLTAVFNLYLRVGGLSSTISSST